MSERHTLGPFHIGKVTDANGLEISNEAFITVGSAHGQDEDDCEIVITGAHAHDVARLIAAAPDMLAALQAIIELDRDIGQLEFEDVFDAARAAIVKATNATT